MNTEVPKQDPIPDETAHQHDERWLLVQRVLASPGFQRAGQLRRMLEYIARAAILNPNGVLREYEIACEVLGRRANFDPTIDNIVRSQMSQLRRRLDVYFTEHARDEPMRIVIARGSYLPQFQRAPPSVPPDDSHDTLIAETSPQTGRAWLRYAGLLLTVAVVVLAVLALWLRFGPRPRRTVAADNTAPFSALAQFLKVRGSDVTIVVPDLSVMLVVRQLKTDLDSQDYSSGSVLESKIAQQTDPEMRDFLRSVATRRLTTVDEAMSAQDLKEALSRIGVNATVRFARDMHTRDFGEGNIILIGSPRSNPWAQLFVPRTNFRFTEEGPAHHLVYRNISPVPGEEAAYEPYLKRDGKYSSYADVAFTTNLTSSGYVLLINGSDFAANEAAIRYIVHGRLRGDFASLLKRDDLTYFEVLLSGSRANNDAEGSFEPLALRPVSRAR